ncbi:MAG TPA: hypothetical protein VM911_07645 [Pyrinomonadaceae bacterium]|jgi:hypothetical protein|nr:hypothetical protein [Pyrinomonadaceae bacterium]
MAIRFTSDYRGDWRLNILPSPFWFNSARKKTSKPAESEGKKLTGMDRDCQDKSKAQQDVLSF